MTISFSTTRGILRQENVSSYQISKLNFDNRDAATQKDIIVLKIICNQRHLIWGYMTSEMLRNYK